jgi:hypothetical protein
MLQGSAHNPVPHALNLALLDRQTGPTGDFPTPSQVPAQMPIPTLRTSSNLD